MPYRLQDLVSLIDQASQDATAIGKQLAAARAAGDVDNASLSFGQDAGLIDSIKSVKEVVQDIVAEAEQIIKSRLPSLLR